MIDQNVIVTVGGDTMEKYYTGSLEGVRIVISDKPLETQCPNIESDKGLNCYWLVVVVVACCWLVVVFVILIFCCEVKNSEAESKIDIILFI